MFVDSLPKLFSQVFVFYQQKNIFRKDPNAGWIILYLFKSILGFLLMSNSRQIAGYVHKHTSEDDDCNQ